MQFSNEVMYVDKQISLKEGAAIFKRCLKFLLGKAKVEGYPKMFCEQRTRDVLVADVQSDLEYCIVRIYEKCSEISAGNSKGKDGYMKCYGQSVPDTMFVDKLGSWSARVINYEKCLEMFVNTAVDRAGCAFSSYLSPATSCLLRSRYIKGSPPSSSTSDWGVRATSRAEVRYIKFYEQISGGIILGIQDLKYWSKAAEALSFLTSMSGDEQIALGKEVVLSHQDHKSESPLLSTMITAAQP